MMPVEGAAIAPVPSAGFLHVARPCRVTPGTEATISVRLLSPRTLSSVARAESPGTDEVDPDRLIPAAKPQVPLTWTASNTTVPRPGTRAATWKVGVLLRRSMRIDGFCRAKSKPEGRKEA